MQKIMNRTAKPKPQYLFNSQPNPQLAGLYFHRIVNGVLDWQGTIAEYLPTPGLVRIQLFSWLMGEDLNQFLVPISDLVWNESTASGYMLYNDAEMMKYAYNDGSARWYRTEMQQRQGFRFVDGKKVNVKPSETGV